MSLYFRAAWILTCLATVVGTGCCCTQGMNSCSGVVGCSSCPTNSCGAGPLMGLASCRGGCGEVYVDEWVSEPPCIDDCGYCSEGCDSPRAGRPVRSLLRLLWGIPYDGGCGCSSGCDSSGGASCSGGCSSCGGGVASEGYVGGMPSGSTHGSQMHVAPTPHSTSPSPSLAPVEAVPTPAPVAPSSAKRLNPAQQRTRVASVSTH